MDKINKQFRHNPRYLKLRKPLEAARICGVALRLAQGRFEVISFKQGLLTLATKNSGEAANLQLESQKIIDEVNQKVGEDVVKNIRYKIK